MVEIGYLIDDDIHDIFITNVQSIKNETLIEAKRKADLYKENEFIELTDIYSTEFRKFSPQIHFTHFTPYFTLTLVHIPISSLVHPHFTSICLTLTLLSPGNSPSTLHTFPHFPLFAISYFTLTLI